MTLMRPLPLAVAFKNGWRKIVVQATYQVAKIVPQSGLGRAFLRSLRLFRNSRYVLSIRQHLAAYGVRDSAAVTVCTALTRLPTALVVNASGGALAHWADIALAFFSISSRAIQIAASCIKIDVYRLSYQL